MEYVKPEVSAEVSELALDSRMAHNCCNDCFLCR